MRSILTILIQVLLSALVSSAPIYPPTNFPDLSKSTLERHLRLTYPSLYDVCLSWKTPSSIRKHFCQEIKLDSALPLQAQATVSLDSAIPLTTTILQALSSQQDIETLLPGHIGGRYEILRGHRALADWGRNRIAAVAQWLDCLDERLIVVLLAFSWVCQIVLVCLIVRDFMNVSRACGYGIVSCLTCLF